MSEVSLANINTQNNNKQLLSTPKQTSKEEEIKNFYKEFRQKELKEILEDLFTEIAYKKPTEIIEFSINSLKKKGGLNANCLTLEERKELEDLRKETVYLKSQINSIIEKNSLISNNSNNSGIITLNSNNNNNNDKHNILSIIENDNLSTYDNEDLGLSKNKLNSLKQVKLNKESSKLFSQRKTVYSESYKVNVFNSKNNINNNNNAEIEMELNPKDESTTKALKKILYKSILFNNVKDDLYLETFIDYMEELNLKPFSTIIRENKFSDYCYFVINGHLECYKNDILMKSYLNNEIINESALLAFTKSEETVITKNECTLFSIKRDVYRNIIIEYYSKYYDSIINKIKEFDIFERLSDYEINKIARIFQKSQYYKGEYVYKENNEGDCFYIIEKGEGIVTRINKHDKKEHYVSSLYNGDCFGECGLKYFGYVRTENILVKSDMTVYVLNRKDLVNQISSIDKLDIYDHFYEDNDDNKSIDND